MGLGLNDNIDEGLVNDNPNTPIGIDPTKIVPQELSQVKLPSELKLGKLDKIITYNEPTTQYVPPTKEQLFGQDIVANELPNFDVKVKIKDEVTKLNDLRYGQSSIYKKGSISQEDIQTLDNVYRGSLINDDNLLGFYTKHASKTQYSETLKQVNDLINKKVFILNENYQKYLQSLKEAANSFKDSFAANSRTLKGYCSLINTEYSTIVKTILQLPDVEPNKLSVKDILTNYVNEFDISQITDITQIVNNFNKLKDVFSSDAKFFKAFIDLYYKKDITVINVADVRAKLYHDDTRYSVVDLMEFIINQLPYLEPVVSRTIDKSIINIDTILNNYLNTASTSNEKIDVISKNQITLDHIEQELFVFEQIVIGSILVCKMISLLVTSLDPEVTKYKVATESYNKVVFDKNIANLKNEIGLSKIPVYLINHFENVEKSNKRLHWKHWKILTPKESADEISTNDFVNRGEEEFHTEEYKKLFLKNTGIKPVWWDNAWVPIASDGSGNCICVDLDPGPGGNQGQVIEWWHDDESRKIINKSFGDWVKEIS